MIKKLTYLEFRELFSKELYEYIIEYSMEQLSLMPDFNDDGAKIKSCITFRIDNEDNKSISSLIVESEIENIMIKKKIQHVFEITSIQLSDDIMPDEILDRYNELKEVGGNICYFPKQDGKEFKIKKHE